MPYGVLELAEFLRAKRFKTVVLPHLSAAYRPSSSMPNSLKALKGH